MYYFRLRPRRFDPVPSDSEHPKFPVDVAVSFYFSPPWPFGMAQGDGSSRITSSSGRLRQNFDRGQGWSESFDPLRPLVVDATAGPITFELRGSRLTATFRAEDFAHLQSEVERIYWRLPLFLNLHFGDPPSISRVTATAGKAHSRWIPQGMSTTTFIATQERQQGYARQALLRTMDNSFATEKRLLAALEYFHVACRLKQLGETPGEFVAEAILNFAKLLDALFPGENTADRAREGLRALGYADAEIELKYVPAIHLRNQLGVGHARFVTLTPAELEAVHLYVDDAEGNFRALLQKVIALGPDERTFLNYEDQPGAGDELRRTIRRIGENYERNPAPVRRVNVRPGALEAD